MGEVVPIPEELCPPLPVPTHAGMHCPRLPDREHSALMVPEQQHLAPRQGLGVPEPPTVLPRFDPLLPGPVFAARLPGESVWPLCHCSVTAPGSDGEGFPGPG